MKVTDFIAAKIVECNHLLNQADEYLDIWRPTFEALEKQAHDQAIRAQRNFYMGLITIYLNAEGKSDEIKVTSVDQSGRGLRATAGGGR